MKKAALLLLLALPGAALAQIESALLSKVTFNLTNPGGKSLAMGGAFTAIADDATAALANPAGLGLLSSLEAGVSGKRTDDRIALSTARATATGNLVAPYPAIRATNADLTATGSSVEYAGVVVPVSSRLVAAVTYAENLRFEADPGREGYQYVELRDNRAGGPATRRDYLYEYRELGAASLRNRLLGLSAGYLVNDRLRVGLGLTMNRTTFDLSGDAGGPHRIVSTAFLTPTQVDVRTTTMAIEELGGTAPGIVVGVHADLLAEGRLTAGASFRATRRTEGTFVIGGDVPVALRGSERRRFSFAVPKDAAAGLAWQPFPGMTIAAEAQWIDYGDTGDEPLPVVSYAGFVGPSPGVAVEDVLATTSAPRDVFVPRLGFEYVAVHGRARVAMRVGYHREPAHGVSADLVVPEPATGTPYDITDPPFSESVRSVFDGGRPDDRFSGGLGATWGRVSVDVAFDLGRNSRQLAVSAFYRF